MGWGAAASYMQSLIDLSALVFRKLKWKLSQLALSGTAITFEKDQLVWLVPLSLCVVQWGPSRSAAERRWVERSCTCKNQMHIFPYACQYPAQQTRLNPCSNITRDLLKLQPTPLPSRKNAVTWGWGLAKHHTQHVIFLLPTSCHMVQLSRELVEVATVGWAAGPTRPTQLYSQGGRNRPAKQLCHKHSAPLTEEQLTPAATQQAG